MTRTSLEQAGNTVNGSLRWPSRAGAMRWNCDAGFCARRSGIQDELLQAGEVPVGREAREVVTHSVGALRRAFVHP